MLMKREDFHKRIKKRSPLPWRLGDIPGMVIDANRKPVAQFVNESDAKSVVLIMSTLIDIILNMD